MIHGDAPAKGCLILSSGRAVRLFVPFPNLGVIVVDEEHDPSYKQTPPVPAPYYHARDLAVKLGENHGGDGHFGSATPDLVSYHHGRKAAVTNCSNSPAG
jgi:primosomal protein N' (replication factor Y) (superfamily II helicase)